MRFVVAIVAFVLAAAAIGLGVAQRTVLAGPDSVASTVVTGSAPLTVIDAATLNANAGTQSIEIEGAGDIVLAYGRTADVLAWVGEASYNEIGWDAEARELTSTVVDGSESAADIPTIAGSDLWLREFTGTDLLTRKINAPEGISVIIAVEPSAAETTEATDPAAVPAEGDAAVADDASAPLDLSITWPLDNSAPASGPLVVGGIVLLLGGLGAFLWALVHARGGRGPRRSTPKLPKRPKPPRLKPQKKAHGDAATPELEAPRAGSGRRRAFVAAGLLTAGALVLTGCTTGDQPVPIASQTPPGGTQPVAVTAGQFDGILVDVAKTVADADAARDANLAAQRLTGPALALRTANYTIRGADSGVAPLAAIPSEIVPVMLPESTDTWPRRVFAIARAEGVQAVGLTLIQESPRENYKVAYAVTLIATVPDVAPAELGSSALPPGNNLGLLAPEELAAAYGDLLIKGPESTFADLFEADDSVQQAIGLDYKTQRRTQLPTSATIEFTNGPGQEDPIAFLTNDSGQIVSLVLDDVETVKPVEAGAAVNPSGQVKALLGKAQSTRGIVATYGVELLVYVPPVSATDQKIVVLGYAQGLVAATEIG